MTSEEVHWVAGKEPTRVGDSFMSDEHWRAAQSVRELIAGGLCPRINYEGGSKLPPHDHQDCLATTDTVLSTLVRTQYVIVPVEAIHKLRESLRRQVRDDEDQQYVQKSVLEAAHGVAKEDVE